MRETEKKTLSRRSTVELALAVRLVDSVTGGQPRQHSSVTTDVLGDPAFQNRSGYHVFLDDELPDELVTVTVAETEYYRATTQTVRVANADVPSDPPTVQRVPRDRPGLVVELAPTTRYPFAPGTSVLRGHVHVPPTGPDDAPTPVPGVTVGIQGVDVDPATTNDTGEYVLVFPRNDAVTVELDAGRPLFKVGGDDPTLTVTHGTYHPISTPVQQPAEAGGETRWDVEVTDSP